MLIAQNLVASVFQREAIDPVLPLYCTKNNALLASLLMIESPATFSDRACSHSPHISAGSKYNNTAVHANEGISVVLNKSSRFESSLCCLSIKCTLKSKLSEYANLVLPSEGDCPLTLKQTVLECTCQ